MSNLDTSGINLDTSSDDNSQIGPVNQEVSELDLSGINLDQSGDIHSETEAMTPPLPEFLAPQETDIPNQSSVVDVPYSVSELARK